MGEVRHGVRALCNSLAVDLEGDLPVLALGCKGEGLACLDFGVELLEAAEA